MYDGKAREPVPGPASSEQDTVSVKWQSREAAVAEFRGDLVFAYEIALEVRKRGLLLTEFQFGVSAHDENSRCYLFELISDFRHRSYSSPFSTPMSSWQLFSPPRATRWQGSAQA